MEKQLAIAVDGQDAAINKLTYFLRRVGASWPSSERRQTRDTPKH